MKRSVSQLIEYPQRLRTEQDVNLAEHTFIAHKDELYDPFYRNQQRYQQYFKRQQAKQNEIYSRHFQEYEIPNQTKKAKMAADDLLMHA